METAEIISQMVDRAIPLLQLLSIPSITVYALGKVAKTTKENNKLKDQIRLLTEPP